ncbi:DUF4435 domain-containing protein [Aeromonas sp. ZOR0002]|uniref:DUF4435 domain-containing protein n=1 Tax=Aeromonas sp. ZOR0002 TaxID=1339228 RepID=UPI0009DCBA19|nr:DUF4435 domain-containing protein [Aeromonas sp. ZOR0002]
MSEYFNYFTNPDYINAYLHITSDNSEEGPDGFVYIESEADKHFWSHLLDSFAKKKYEFKIQAKEKRTIRGKRALEELYTSANEKALVAVDSDFDYISPNRSVNAKQMNGNKYVLQTYAYSVESLSFDVLRVDHCLSQFYYFEPNQHKLSKFLEQYSQHIYLVLMKYLFLMDTLVAMQLKESSFHDEIIPSEPVRCYEENSFGTLKDRVSLLDKQLTPMIANINAFEAFLQLSHFKGLQESNCYKFIRGHDVEEKIIYPIVNHIKRTQISQEMERIKASTSPNLWDSKRKEIKNHFDGARNFRALVSISPYAVNDKIYEKICDHVKSLSL